MAQLICCDHIRYSDGTIVRLSDPEGEYVLFEEMAAVLDSPTSNRPQILAVDHKAMQFMWCDQDEQGAVVATLYRSPIGEYLQGVLEFRGILHGFWEVVEMRGGRKRIAIKPGAAPNRGITHDYGTRVTYKRGKVVLRVHGETKTFNCADKPVHACSYRYGAVIRVAIVFVSAPDYEFGQSIDTISSGLCGPSYIRVFMIQGGRLKAKTPIVVGPNPVACYNGHVQYRDGSVWHINQSPPECVFGRYRKMARG